jgi:hypothetical protein
MEVDPAAHGHDEGKRFEDFCMSVLAGREPGNMAFMQ